VDSFLPQINLFQRRAPLVSGSAC